MSFVRVGLTGYYNPVKMIEQLRSEPAPQWGFYGQFLRAALDSLLVYLPVALMGRIPPTPSNLSFLPTEQYHWHLIWLSPIILGADWLLAAAFTHVVLRLAGWRSDFDQILNIGGMAALVVGAFLSSVGLVVACIGRCRSVLPGHQPPGYQSRMLHGQPPHDRSCCPAA